MSEEVEVITDSSGSAPGEVLPERAESAEAQPPITKTAMNVINTKLNLIMGALGVTYSEETANEATTD